VKILIADDDPVSRRLLEATLLRMGHEVVAVSDGLEAVDLMLSAGGPRLAILDWMMPKADGLTVCRTLRERSATYVYVILLTTRDRREDMMAALDAEADDFVTKPFDVVELGARIRSGERVLGLQEQLIAAHEALHHEATHDRLTGLWNRGRILDQLGRELIRSRREHRPLSVVIADIDHFKRINDTHGHRAGDDVLRQVAERMNALSAERDCLGRYGGEEFLIVLPGCPALDARAVADRLRAAVASSPTQVGTTLIPVTVSFGVASTDRADEQPATLINAADEALYRAKAAGRNRVETAPLLPR
jgi:diguanylate cyclase (GGDEF)-like protein